MTRATGRFFSAAPALLAALTFGVAPAAATIMPHQKLGSFTGSDAPGGPFGILLPSDAVDQSNGDVYVTESGAFGGQNVVDKFDESGNYAGVQLTGAKIPGQETFAFGFFPGVAVDNSTGPIKGDVYVSDTGHGVVDRFTSTGEFLCQISGEETPSANECDLAGSGLAGSIEPAGVAVDSAGDVYVADDTHAAIDKFAANGEYLSQIKDRGRPGGGRVRHQSPVDLRHRRRCRQVRLGWLLRRRARRTLPPGRRGRSQHEPRVCL
jgi:hypothetical protein